MDSITKGGEYKEEAIPLITYDTNQRKFYINPSAEEIIKTLDSPLGIISVAGMYRTGKSYLLNRLLLNRSTGFSIGPSINPCTKGLWVWTKPISGHTHDGAPINVLIIDTEGIGATDEDQNHDSKIFTLAILLSSYFLFNSLGSIDENAIQNLSFIVNISKNIQLNSGKEEVDPKDYAKYLPSFMWVIRDFSLQLKDNEGEPITSKEYLERSLELQKGYSDSVEQKNKIRNMLKQFFRERDCVTLVRPLTDEENLQNLGKMDITKLRPEFLEQINHLRKKVLHKVKPKSLNGQNLNGEMFCTLMHAYVEAINNGAVPVIENAWSYLCKNECQRAMITAVSIYERMMNENVTSKMPIEEYNLKRIHKDSKEIALEHFHKHAIGMYNEEFLKQLKTVMKEKILQIIIDNDKETKKECYNFISRNYSEIEKKVNLGKYKCFNEYKNDIDCFISHYNDKGPQGPGKKVYLFETILKSTIETSEIFIKNQIDSIENISVGFNDRVAKLTNDFNEAKYLITNELNEKNKLVKMYQHEKNELLESEQFTKESISSLRKEKEQIYKELTDKIEIVKRDYEKQLIESRNKLFELEENYKEKERKVINSETELDKQRLLFEQKVKFLERNVEDLSVKEKEYLVEMKNIRKDNIHSNKDSLEKYENQIKQLARKTDTLQEKNIDLETKLLEKEKRLENERNKSEEMITDLNKTISELNNIINLNDEEVRRLENKSNDVLDNVKSDYERRISELQTIKEDLEAKLKDCEEKYINIKIKSGKEISTLKQTLEFSDLQVKEMKIQNAEEKRSHEVIMNMIENKNTELANENEEYIKKISNLTNTHSSELDKIKSESEKLQTKYIQELENITERYQEISKSLEEEKENIEKMNNLITEKDTELDSLKNKIEIILKSFDMEKGALIESYQSKWENMIRINNEKTEEILRNCREELEENNNKNEKVIFDIRKYYENERINFESSLNEEKEKVVRTLNEQETYFREKMKELERVKEEKIEELEETIESLEANHNNYVVQTEQDIILNNQQIESLNRFLNETKDNLLCIQQSHKEVLEEQHERFNVEKTSFMNKIDVISLECNRKEKELAIMLLKKEQMEEILKTKDLLIETLKSDFDNEKKELNDQIIYFRGKVQSQNDQILINKGEYTKELALKTQENEFLDKKISELQKCIEDNNLNNDEKLKSWKESLQNEYDERIQNLEKEKEDIEIKLIQKKKEIKENEINNTKDRNMLEKEKAVLLEKLVHANRQKDEISDSVEKERESMQKQLIEIKETKRMENEMKIKENEFLKNKLKSIEKEYNELSSNYEKDKDLWSAKFEFLEEQRSQARQDLTECQKKFEMSLENIQKKGGFEKDKLENTQKGIMLSVEERYKSQIRDMQENYVKALDTTNQRKKELEQEVKTLQMKLSNEQKSKYLEQNEINKKLTTTIEKEAKLKKNYVELQDEKDKKINEMAENFEIERESYKMKMKELELKCREYESKRNNMAVDVVKEKAVNDKEKDSIQKEVEKLNDKLIFLERNFNKVTNENKELTRESDKLKRENKGYKSNNNSIYVPRYHRYTTGNKENNRNHSNTSFDKTYDNFDILSFNNKKFSSKLVVANEDDISSNDVSNI